MVELPGDAGLAGMPPAWLAAWRTRFLLGSRLGSPSACMLRAALLWQPLEPSDPEVLEVVAPLLAEAMPGRSFLALPVAACSQGTVRSVTMMLHLRVCWGAASLLQRCSPAAYTCLILA